MSYRSVPSSVGVCVTHGWHNCSQSVLPTQARCNLIHRRLVVRPRKQMSIAIHRDLQRCLARECASQRGSLGHRAANLLREHLLSPCRFQRSELRLKALPIGRDPSVPRSFAGPFVQDICTERPQRDQHLAVCAKCLSDAQRWRSTIRQHRPRRDRPLCLGQ